MPYTMSRSLSLLVAATALLSLSLLLTPVWSHPDPVVAAAHDDVLGVNRIRSASETSPSLSCDLLISIDIDDTMELHCEIGTSIYPIDNHSSDFDDLVNSGRLYAESGLRLEVEGAYVSDDDHFFVIPAGAEIGFHTFIDPDQEMGGRGRRRLARGPTGMKDVMVIYVTDINGLSPKKQAKGFTNSIQDDVFGTKGDALNLANVYEQCSAGALDFRPFEGTANGKVFSTANDNVGIYEITINIAVPGAERNDVQNAANAEATRQLGNLSNTFDYVIFCFPKGSQKTGNANWLGYAYLNSWNGYYNDEWCSSLSTLAHEIGHNLNLGHSGVPGGSEYADEIGMMGFGYSTDDGPNKCFNAPKTYQLGWFSTNNHVDLTSADFSYTGNLYGLANADSLKNDAAKKMIIKLNGSTGGVGSTEDHVNYFVSFNRAIGINSGTKGSINKVVIHSSQYVNIGPKSLRLAELGAGQKVVLTIKGLEVNIEVTSIDLTSDPAFAIINIYTGPSDAPSLSLSPSKSNTPSSTPSLSVQPSATSMPSLSEISLMTTLLFGDYYAASKGGVMFDITVTEEITLSKLDISLFWLPGAGVAGIDTLVEVYAKSGSYATGSFSDWTQHMSATISPTGVLTTLDESTGLVPIGMKIGTTAIYITNRDANNYITFAWLNTAKDHSNADNTVTIKTGKFKKYDRFANGGTDFLFMDFYDFAFAGIIYYQKTGNFPSSEPSVTASDSPSLSQVPSLSLVPSSSPSVSMSPSDEPSRAPSSVPSVSVKPTTFPSDGPSAIPSVSMQPSAKPSKAPTETPTANPTTKAPTKRPTRRPTKAPTKMPSTRPSLTQDPSGIRPSGVPSLSLQPTVSSKPSVSPGSSNTPSETGTLSLAPSINRFQIVTTKCYVKYPFRGISQSQLDLRFAAMVALWTKAFQDMLPNKADWGVRIVNVGNRDVRRLLSTSRALQGDAPIDVNVELINIKKCEGDDGCSDSDLSESYDSGKAVLSGLVETAKSGALIAAILEGAKAAGLDDVVSGLTVDEVVTQDPQTEVVDSTSSPTAASVTLSPSPPSATPTCRDSSLRFRVMYNDKLRSKSCEWVARHPSRKCEIEGVSEHCPNTCGSCETCSDSTMVFYHEDIYNEDIDQEKTGKCAWVARKDTDTRCAIPGVADTCRSTCNNCGCSDVDGKFDFTFGGATISKSCAWAGRKNTDIRCAKATVASNCPATCGNCASCADSTTEEFPLENVTGKSQKCSWLLGPANPADRQANYCKYGDVKYKCASTCGFCGVDCPADDSSFTFTVVATGVNVGCEWLGKKNSETRRAAYCSPAGVFYDPAIRSTCAQGCGFCL